jgi:argonaute-like protein implicated in RNA metabolism and viral defense
MRYIDIFKITDFKLKFADGESVNAYDIIRLGPLSSKPFYDSRDIGVENYRRLLILYSEADNSRRYADILTSNLSEGYKNNKKIFPGINRALRTSFEIDVASFRDYDPEKIYETYDQHSPSHEAFPIIILPKSPRSEYGSIYYRTKATFLMHDTPCQIVTRELLDNENSLKWSLLSIATQIYAKMGGIPYGLDRSVIRPGWADPSDTMVAVMGLGISAHPQLRRRGVGFIVVFDHKGVWNFMDVEVLAMDSWERMSEQVTKLFERGLSRILSRDAKKYNILVIHYSGKEIGGREEEAIRNAINNARSVGKFAAIYVLKVKDSDIIVGYMGSPHRSKSERPTWYPHVGTIFMLKPDVYLLVTTGYFSRNGRIVSNIGIGLPSTKIISRHREIEVGGLDRGIKDIDLLRTVFAFMRLNYRSISNPVATEPVTIRYSREIAWIILRLADLGVDVKMLNRLSRVMWFL